MARTRPTTTPRPLPAPAEKGAAGSLRVANELLALGAILLATVAAYVPAMSGGMLWDDPAHLTRPELRNIVGLFRIWFDLGTTQQYYPLTDSLFWLQAVLWGEWFPGYHAVTLGLHLLNVVLAYRILRLLGAPGALLAVGLFALHPVHAESVAWMTQLKNTLSGALYLGAMLCYLRFDRDRNRRHYAWAMVLLAMALLSKTVTATMPAAALLLIWYRRGALEWARDVRPVLPLFAMGIAGGLFTAWFEYSLVGASGAQFSQPFLHRLVLAGRAPWFYAGSLLWPANLMFHYPRWHLDPSVWQQWILPAASLVLLGLLWWGASRRRGAVTAVLFFLGTLFPALGFLNVYHFRFSFVADHFQYLASLGVFVLLAGTLAVWWRRAAGWQQYTGLLGAVVLAPLAVMTWSRSHLFGSDDIALYRATAAVNPQSWITESNWGAALIRRGQHEAALPHLQAAIRIAPSAPEPYHDAGVALTALGRKAEAIAMYQRAVALDPLYWRAQYLLGDAFASDGRFAEAIAPFRAAVQRKPDFAAAHLNLAGALLGTRAAAEAVTHLEQAERHAPDVLEVQARVARLYASLGLNPQARRAAERAYGLATAQRNSEAAARMQALITGLP